MDGYGGTLDCCFYWLDDAMEMATTRVQAWGKTLAFESKSFGYSRRFTFYWA